MSSMQLAQRINSVSHATPKQFPNLKCMILERPKSLGKLYVVIFAPSVKQLEEVMQF